MDKWSKKYQKWFRCEDNKHSRNNNLYQFGDYFYNIKTDKLIHKDVVDDYIDNCNRLRKKKRKDAYCTKHNIEIKD